MSLHKFFSGSFLSIARARQAEDLESASLLNSPSSETTIEETIVKHNNHGSIPAVTTNEFLYPNTIQDTTVIRKDFSWYWQHGFVQQEILAIIKFGVPLIITFLLGYGNRVVDIWFLGKTGSESMAVASLASLFTNITCLSIGMGMLTAVETLVAQAFTGSRNPKTVGIIVQRAFLIVNVFGVFIAISWGFADRILIYFGQSPELAQKAQQYIIRVIPHIFIFFTVICYRKFLSSIGEMKVTMYLLFVLTPVNFISNYYFLVYKNWSYLGAAYHVLTCQIVLLIIYTLFVFLFTNATKYWPGFTKQVFQHWGEFLKLGIPGMLSVSTDWAFEVCAIVAGVLGQTSLAAQAVVLTCNTWLLMIPNALASSVMVRLGHHLGANRPERTKLCVTIAVLIGLLFVSIDASLLYRYRSFIAHNFATDPDVIQAIEELMGVACLGHFFLGFSIILSGTLNAFAKQPLVAFINLTSYFLVGLPAGLVLTNHYNWGLIGIWSGVVISGVIKTCVETVYIFFIIDWEKECFNAGIRIKKQEHR